GGKTWTKTLYVDENTSATELIIDPSNPQNLWASMYQRQRTAWGFSGGGKGSGLYKSADGGRTWSKVEGNGLPRGTMGRIALDICKTQPIVIYAQIEVAPDKEPALAGAPVTPQGDPGGRGRGAAAAPDPQISGVWRSNDK